MSRDHDPRESAGQPTPGAASRSRSQARARALVGFALVLYAAGFCAFYPSFIVNADESCYVRLATALSRGENTVPALNPETCVAERVHPSHHPAGVSLLQTPFVFAGGWKAAPLLSLLSLAATMLLLVLWLESRGLCPLYALLFLGYPAALVLGRVGLSDLPCTAAVVLAYWAFFEGARKNRSLWLLAGVAAGASSAIRETAPLFLFPLFVGACWRRERGFPLLLLGGIGGLALRILASWVGYGDPLYLGYVGGRIQLHYGWSLEGFLRNLPFYAGALLVFVPGGLIAGLLYRGPRRWDINATVALVFVFFTSFEFGSWEAGGLRGFVLGTRYFLPLLPLLIVCLAEELSRLSERLALRFGEATRKRLRAAQRGAVLTWVAAVLVGIVAVHYWMDRWSASQREIAEAIYSRTLEGEAVVTSYRTTQKFLSELYGLRAVVRRELTDPRKVPKILAACGSARLVIMDRHESTAPFQRELRENSEFVSSLQRLCRTEIEHDRWYTAKERLRIWNISACDPGTADEQAQARAFSPDDGAPSPPRRAD